METNASKLVLFLGAGFSAALGYPVMITFLDFSERVSTITDSERSLLGSLLLETRDANSFFESNSAEILS